MSNIKKSWDGVPKWVKYTLFTVLGAAGAVLLGLLLGNVIMWLWNWLMPKIFGLGTIGFWEALGLLLLTHLLFGFGSSSHSEDGEKRRHKRRCSDKAKTRKKNWKDWEYYDDWWEEDGEAAFRAYAERMNKEPGGDDAAKEPSAADL